MRQKIIALAAVLAVGLFAAWTMMLVKVASAGIFDRRVPAAHVVVEPSTIAKGEKATLTWETNNAQSVTLDGEVVAAVGSREVSPDATTSYKVMAHGRRRVASASATLTVTGEQPEPAPDPDPIPPEPNPEPTPGTTLSAVGIWTALGADSKLGMAAHSHDVAELLRSQNGGWLVIDELMAKDATHPKWVDEWLAALKASGKTQPAVIWHDRGKVLAIDQCSTDTDAATLLKLAKSHLPSADDAVVIRGKVHALGLKPRTTTPGRVMADGEPIPQISAVLKPLDESHYPEWIDLGSQITRTKDQNGHGSCVSQALATAMEALRYAQFGPENDVELSPNNLATQIGGWNGAYASEAVQALMKSGIVSMADQPNYSSKYPAGWKTKAAGYKVLAIYDSPDSDYVGYLASALSRGWLVPIGIGVGSGFDADGDGYISYARGSGSGGHEVLACGLKKHDGKWWIRIKNSWGADWGEDGFAWIESKFLSRSEFADLWVLVVTTAAPTDKAFSPAASLHAAEATVAPPRQPPTHNLPTPPASTGAAEPSGKEAGTERPGCPGGKCGVAQPRRGWILGR